MSDSTSAPELTIQEEWARDGYVLGYKSQDGDTEIWHLGGRQWFEAPIPSRVHLCKPQTRGWINWFTQVDRCACGAHRDSIYRRWSEKNQRRHG